MARMVRKQVYIKPRQEAALKRLARLRGVSEAEIIRRAIDREESVVSAEDKVSSIFTQVKRDDNERKHFSGL